jgi:hypothetical protein
LASNWKKCNNFANNNELMKVQNIDISRTPIAPEMTFFCGCFCSGLDWGPMKGPRSFAAYAFPMNEWMPT